MVIKTRRQLADLGYIRLHELEVERQQRVYVTLLYFWPRNIAHFANLPKRQKQPSWAELLDAEPDEGGYGITGGGHTVEGGGYTVEHKNNHQEKPSSKNQATVDPRNTSRTCPCCGHIDQANRPNQATFLCVDCGFSGLADHIAAVNIRRAAAGALWAPPNVPTAGSLAASGTSHGAFSPSGR